MIQITADTRRAVVTNKELLTVGSAGIQVEFTLSEDWSALSKLAVFRVGDDGTKVDVVLGESLTCVVPPEVLTEEGEVLFIGVYGTNGQGTVIIPTVWASAGVVKPGTEPETPASAEPTPEIWAQILGVANDAEQTAADAMSIVEDVVNHTPIIQDGYWYFWNEDAQEYQSTGIKAEGEDGTSPTITVVDIEGGHRVTITDVDHPQGQTIDVMNGTDGDDGYSPAVTIAEITGGHRVTITDETHPQGQSFDVMDGASDAGDIEFDPTETYAAGSIGAEVSQQKNAIKQKAPLIINTASGDIASFADGADGMQIRKIVGTIVTPEGGSGWTGANIYVTNENIIQEGTLDDWTVLGGKKLYDAETQSFYTTDRIRRTFEYEAPENGTYVVSLDGWEYSTGYTYSMRLGLVKKDGTMDKNYIGHAFSKTGFSRYSKVLTMEKGDKVVIDPLYGGYKIKNFALQKTSSAYIEHHGYTLPINWQDTAGAILNGTVTLNEDESADIVNSDSGNSYHLENIGSLSTYLGTNNIWIDCGSISECDYPADTKLYIDGLTAPDEDMIANANIESGKYFVVNNQLYLSTAAIAAGASIVPGTNCTATNLAEALNALNT